MPAHDETPLAEKHCKPVKKGGKPVDPAQAAAWLKTLPGWQSGEGNIAKSYKFKDFHETMAFVNAVAWIAHQENHHPDLTVGYNACRVQYSTHDVGGLSESDFICAAKVEKLMNE